MSTPPGPPAPAATESKFPLNPGTVEDIHKRCQGIFPMFFEGAKLIVNKGLNANFQVSHTLSMSSPGPAGQTQPSGYRFGATYVGSHVISPSEAYPLLMADVDPSGNMNASLIHAVSDSIRFKCLSQIQQSKWVSAQLTGDYRAPLYTASFTLGNPDLIHGSGVAVAHYLRAITKRLALGCELVYQAAPQIPGGHIAVASIAARYAGDAFALAGTLGNGGTLHASFYQQCSETLQIGVEMETNLKMQESTASIGYEVDIKKGEFTFRGAVDTNFVVKTALEKKLLPLPFTLALCSSINHKKNSFQFGCGLIIG